MVQEVLPPAPLAFFPSLKRLRPRLWCTYEVGTFLRDPLKAKPILVMPVFSVVEHLIMFGYFLSKEINLDYQNDPGQLMSFWLFYIPVLAPLMPLLYFIGLGMSAELKELPNQLQEFRVQDAKCFCCSHGHRHPDTGEALACDRDTWLRVECPMLPVI